MIYQKFQPAEILTPFVECYFAWESEGPLEKELVVESPPNSYCSIAMRSLHGLEMILSDQFYANYLL